MKEKDTISGSNTENPNFPHPFIMTQDESGHWEITKIYIDGKFMTLDEAKKHKRRKKFGNTIMKYVNNKWTKVIDI